MVPPPTQPKGLNPLEGFLSVDHSPCMVPWCFPPSPNLKGWIPLKVFSVLIIFPVWYPDVPPQPKGLNPLEGFLIVDHFPCNVCLWWGSRSDASVPMGKRKTDSPSTPKSAFCVWSELIFGVGSEFLVLGVSRCWKWVDFWCWKWVVNPIYLSIYFSIYLSTYLSIYLSTCGAVSFSVM